MCSSYRTLKTKQNKKTIKVIYHARGVGKANIYMQACGVNAGTPPSIFGEHGGPHRRYRDVDAYIYITAAPQYKRLDTEHEASA